MSHISLSEKKYIIDGINQDIRTDGRHCNVFRKLELETSIIQQCHGSARVRTVDGGTDILSSVKIEVMNTTEEAPNCGDIDVNVDFTASSSVHFRDREYELESIDLARKIKSFLLIQGGFDISQLCIVEGLYAWKLDIDVQILDDNGNLFDIILYCIYSALLTTKLPQTRQILNLETNEKDFEINDDTCTYVRLDCSSLPLSLTIYNINNKPVVDCTNAEEQCSESSVSISVNKSGKICKIQTLQGCINTIQLSQYISIATNVAEGLFKSLESVTKKDDELWTSDIIPDRKGFFA